MIELNEEQKIASQFQNGIAVCLAVPGAGKTTVVIRRICNLVKEYGIAPENILGLTFTRNAAEAMRTRLMPILDDKSKRVMLQTIHSFCLYLLKHEGIKFNVLTGKEQMQFIGRILKQMKLKNISIGMVLREISLAKNNMIDVAEFRTLYEGDNTFQKVADVYEAYDNEKRKKLLFDFDDLLLETYKLLSTNDEVRSKYREHFQHILVDEYQDTNPLQGEIVKLLVDGKNGDSSFFAVGDDWQSIYAFTGATVTNIVDFNKTFPNSEQFIMSLNYRSTPQIIKACQNLIHHNERKIEKEMKANNPDGEDIIVLESVNEDDEALTVVNEIKELIERGFEYDGIAVLYRANFQSRYVEEAFSQHKIPYVIENGLNFYQRSEVKVLLDYLRLIHNPVTDEADEALLNVINTPNRYCGRNFVKNLENYASENEIHLFEALSQAPIELKYVQKNVQEFLSLLNPLIKDAKTLEPAEAILLLREALDYDSLISEEDIPAPDDNRLENVNQLTLAAAKYSYIESFLKYTESFQDMSSGDKSGVHLMTIHKAKGLEFEIVLVVGMVEGILPSKRGDKEEERRIAFVGISRAMKLLYLSYTCNYLGQPCKKSLFINEVLGMV